MLTPVDFVVITALEEELNAIRDKLPDWEKLPPTSDDIRVYYRSLLPVTFPNGSTTTYSIIVTMIGRMSRVPAATATSDAIKRWKPRKVLLVGIAGGIVSEDERVSIGKGNKKPRVSLGDVLVSDQVVDYETQKVAGPTPQYRFRGLPADPRLYNAAMNLPDTDWKPLIGGKRPVKRGTPKRIIGPIATGDKVASYRPLLNDLLAHYPKLIGIEMEAGGVATAAAEADPPPGFFMIRGVSDLGDENKGSSSVERWRDYACDVAAAYAVALLKSGPLPPSSIQSAADHATEQLDAVYKQTDSGGFVGRDWLMSDLDAFINAHDRGFWLLTGEAGVGKTSFLAHLVQKRGYLHYFVGQAASSDQLTDFQYTLAAQLIIRYKLEPYLSSSTLETLRYDPNLLWHLLLDASTKLGKDERLVIVIDALDKVVSIPGQNALGLPHHLPPNTYFILSQQPTHISLNIQAPFKRMSLEASDPDNQKDIDAYLHRVSTESSIDEQLCSHGYTGDRFVQALSEKSAGNWIYLHYLVEEIRQRRRDLIDLSTLPNHLVGYYGEYWSRYRELPDRHKWDECYAPILSLLIVTYDEPPPLSVFKQWLGVQIDTQRLERVLGEDWQAFVYQFNDQRFRFRHSSCRDFFTSTLEANLFPVHVETLTQEMERRSKSTHRCIATHLQKDRQFDEWLRFYKSRFLTQHLLFAEDYNNLFKLVEQHDWKDFQLLVDPSGSTYSTDLGRARTALYLCSF